MAWVTDQFVTIWKRGHHIGRFRPTTVVEVSNTRLIRSYRAWPGPKVNAIIPGETKAEPWWPHLHRYTDWREVPNIKRVEIQQDFTQNGCQVATVEVDNVAYVEEVGAMGRLYHLVQRGYYSPLRGKVPETRGSGGVEPNEWEDLLRQMIALRVWEGFGPPVRDEDGSMPEDGGPNGTWVFNGLVDKPDLDSVPAQITLTARMGKTLTDQRLFGWNKSRSLRDPVTFCDRLAADEEEPVGYHARASTEQDSAHPARNVLDKDPGDGTEVGATYWHSADHSASNVTEWVQIHVPQGRYTDFRLTAPAGHEIYVGVYPRNQLNSDDSTSPPSVDGVAVDAEEWWGDPADVVPGGNGGWVYTRSFVTTAGTTTDHSLGGEFHMGKGSVIRVGVRQLLSTSGGGAPFIASIRGLFGLKRRRLQEATAQKWILIDDVMDMARVVLRWGGFKEWEIEDSGIRLPGKRTYNRSQFLIEPINFVTELTGHVFFIADPDTGESRGVPTLRRNSTLLRQPGALAAELTERDLLTGLKGSLDEEPLSFIIRVRGKEAARRAGGRRLGGDRVRRLMYVLRPPWSEAAPGEDPFPEHMIGGVLKHVIKTYNHARTVEECKMGAYLIALGEALEYAKVVAETAGAPHVELDDQVGLLDTATGINSRMWVASRTTTLITGEHASWKSTLSGTLIDNPLVVALLEQLSAATFETLVHPIQTRDARQPRIR